MSLSLSDLFNALSKVKTLSLTVIEKDSTKKAEATVKVEHLSENVILFYEKGAWLDASKLSFTNHFKWSYSESKLSLQHFRQGLDHPELLFEFSNHQNNHWKSAEPYLCAPDCYTGEISYNNKTIELRCNVKGPQKDYTMIYEYR